MIDSKRLEELAARTKDTGYSVLALDQEEASELLELARLGLWSREHGVPALKKIGVNSGEFDPRRVGHIAYGLFVTGSAVAALAALPATERERG